MLRIYSVDAPETKNRWGRRGRGHDSLLCVAASRLPLPRAVRKSVYRTFERKIGFLFFCVVLPRTLSLCVCICVCVFFFSFFPYLARTEELTYPVQCVYICKSVYNASIIDYVIRSLVVTFAPQRATGCHLFYAGVATI